MDVRDVVLRIARRSGLCDRGALLDRRSALDEQRPEMGEGRLVAVASGDRHGQAVRGNLPGERDLPTRRRAHEVGATERDVDATVLPARVLVLQDGKLAKHRAVRGPCPRP